MGGCNPALFACWCFSPAISFLSRSMFESNCDWGKEAVSPMINSTFYNGWYSLKLNSAPLMNILVLRKENSFKNSLNATLTSYIALTLGLSSLRFILFIVFTFIIFISSYWFLRTKSENHYNSLIYLWRCYRMNKRQQNKASDVGR